MRGVSQRFGAVQALDRVDFDLRPGEIHALIGENGAGKTTLMSILYGLRQPTAGTIRLDGREVRIASPAQALALGVGMVHQHFKLVPTLSVAENVVLGDGRRPFSRDRRGENERVAALAERHGLRLDPSAQVGALSVGGQQRVELLKLLHRDARILLLDEPTAVLTPAEADELTATLTRLRADGCSVVLISHKLREIRRVADRVTVLRRGVRVFSGPMADATDDELARQMVGSDPPPPVRREPTTPGAEVFGLTNVRVGSGARPLRVAELTVREGEIVAVVGVEGNGQDSLAAVAVGLTDPASGERRLLGNPRPTLTPGDATALGVAVIPADRQADGLVLQMTVAENLALKAPPTGRFGWLSPGELTRTAEKLIELYGIRTSGAAAPAASLSGGNQQKIVIARELSRSPRLIVAVNPSRGLDLGATHSVHDRLLAARAAGTAVLLITTELDEALALGDRFAVLYDGRLNAAPPGADRDTLGRLMAGSEPG